MMSYLKKPDGILYLEDGTSFEGSLWGDTSQPAVGEVVFNTSLCGYQEILTDPSYCGQIVTMTNPLIGNTGINTDDRESCGVFCEGFVVHEISEVVSNWRSSCSLQELLEEEGICGISGVDTRALTIHLRDHGAKVGVIAPRDTAEEKLKEKIASFGTLEGKNLAEVVSTKEKYSWNEGLHPLNHAYQRRKQNYNVAVYDLGVKRSILRYLVASGCSVDVFPLDTNPEELLSYDGIFLSNGPGDPAAVSQMRKVLPSLLGRKPLFGICLGHQILSLSFGAETYKMKFGHHGGNQPVRNMKRKEIEITAQNHSFAVDADSLPADLEVTHLNLNDHTLEGIRHKSMPAFSVQYHPESSPGPHDSMYLFDTFVEMMEKERKCPSA